MDGVTFLSFHNLPMENERFPHTKDWQRSHEVCHSLSLFSWVDIKVGVWVRLGTYLGTMMGIWGWGDVVCSGDWVNLV